MATELRGSTTDTLSQVLEFEQACGAAYPLTPKQPHIDTAMLRMSLRLEELYELAQGLGLEWSFQKMLAEKSGMKNSGGNRYIGDLTAENTYEYNAVAVLDALVDMQYVNNGTVIHCGLQDSFYDAFANIHASNLSKFPDSEKVMEASIDAYLEKGVHTRCSPTANGHWVVKRESDNKILKSVAYTPANLLPILEKHGYTSTPSGN